MDSRETKNGVEINVFELVARLAKYWRFIGGTTVGAAVVSLVFCLLWPPTFVGETKILPPQQNSSTIATQLLNQLGGFASLAPAALGVNNQNDLYIGIIRSRTVFDKIIDRFGLMKLYDVEYREDARKELDDVLTARSGKDGMIDITVEDGDPQRAADMANAFVDELVAVTRGLAITEAAQRRLFFEEQLRDTKTALAKAENGMKAFQEKTGALQIDEQARAVIQGIGALKAQIAAKEVEYKVAQTYTTSQNPDLQRIAMELNGLRGELGKLEQKGGAAYDPLMPTRRMPSVGLEYLRKLRDVKYYETLYELLAKQYEMAKLDEGRDAVVIQVVDKAVRPGKKAKPKTANIVALCTTAAFLFSFFVSVYLERHRIVIKSIGAGK